GTLTERYPRLVRDLGRKLDKQVDLEVTGAEIEIDRGILEHLDGALIHLIRNAVDHGIERAEERRARGKAPSGTVRISASRDRDAVLVVVSDDGAGLDPERLKLLAIDKGLLSAEEAERLSAREAYFLICVPGFSTKAEVSDVSGRGVGMDAVREQVEGLGGSLDIESELGRSTRISLRMPLTLAIVHALLVNVGKHLLAVPINKVVAVRELTSEVLRPATGGRYLSFQHALVPVVELAEHLRIEGANTANHCVVIEDGRDLAALAVHQIVGYREVVVKTLGQPLESLQWFSGAAILGDGLPMLLLDVPHALRARSLSS
ncbi:MAG: chemotaxis protein CheW, partial [Myxococcota bacterium]